MDAKIYSLPAPRNADNAYRSSRAAPHSAQPLLDCRACIHQLEHMCSSPHECNSGDKFHPRAPLRLWRGA